MTTVGNIRIHDMYEYHKPVSGERCFLYRGFDTATNTWKWMAKGTHIPFPVRSGTWFNGFDPVTMHRWMYQQDWVLHTRVVMP